MATPSKTRKKTTKPAVKASAPKKVPRKSAKPATPNTVTVDGKERYHEPAPQGIDVESFRQVVSSRRSVRKFTDKPIPKVVLDDCLDMALLAPCACCQPVDQVLPGLLTGAAA